MPYDNDASEDLTVDEYTEPEELLTGTAVGTTPVTSEPAEKQAAEDAAWRAENPGKVLTRPANPLVGGE